MLITIRWMITLHTVITLKSAFCVELCVPVYITVHSAKPYSNQLELNWNNACNHGITWVGLFEEDPIKNTFAIPIVKISPEDYPSGYYLTSVFFNFDKLPGNWDSKDIDRANRVIGPQCLHYWIATFQNNKTIHVNCLKIQPTWMSDHLNLKRIPLADLLIPGTHNSGSFDRNVFKNPIMKPYRKFVLNQIQDVWTQLVFGIRYLDFRIGYYEPGLFSKNKETFKRFWINHSQIKVTRLYPLLQDIKKFLESTENEVIILDVHRLPIGFKSQTQHNQLRELLQSEFENLAVDFQKAMRTWSFTKSSPTIEDIVKSGKRLIICYPNPPAEIQWLWPALPQRWGNVEETDQLLTYISSEITKRSAYEATLNPYKNPFWAIMGHLTSSKTDVILKNNDRDNRLLAQLVNRNLTIRVEQEWWDKLNIVATDFFLGNNLIELSIESIVYKKRNV